MTRSAVRSNTAANEGGLFLLAQPLSTISTSVIHNNVATQNGAGIFNDGSLTGVHSFTVSNNYTNLDGGGIFNSGGTSQVELISSSVIDNDADHDRDQLGGTGGGIYALGRVAIWDALIARNTQLGFFDDDYKGALDAIGRSLFGTLTGFAIANAAGRGLVAQDSIGPLQNNGGPTLTHALLLGSAAINGTLAGDSCNFSIDQCGAPLIAGLRCDVGAFEFGSIVPVSENVFGIGFEQGDCGPICFGCDVRFAIAFLLLTVGRRVGDSNPRRASNPKLPPGTQHD